MISCGSNFLGYCLSASSLLFLSHSIFEAKNLIYLMVLFSLPLADMLLVIVERLIRKKNIFLPDKNHIHHKLMKLNIKYKNIICLLFSYSALTVTVGIFYLRQNNFG